MSNLGFIPSWQFSQDAKTNPALNPFVTYPEGMFQTTTQPVGPYYQTSAPSMQSNMSGHRLNLSEATPTTTVVDQTNAMFDSWWWKNRKPLVVGGIALVGLSLAASLAAILR
jgi:hypothetical protein